MYALQGALEKKEQNTGLPCLSGRNIDESGKSLKKKNKKVNFKKSKKFQEIQKFQGPVYAVIKFLKQ